MPISEELPKTSMPKMPLEAGRHPERLDLPPPVRRNTVRTLGPGFIILLIAAVAAAVWLVKARQAPDGPPSAKAPPVVTVGTAKVAYRQIPRTLLVTGSISALDQLSVGAEPNGLRIDDVRVEEGDTVRKGQVLATLDSSVLRAQRRQLEARLAAARAGIPKAMQPNRPQDIAGLQSARLQAEANEHQQHANLIQARANLDNAEKNYARYAKLLADGYVTTKDMEDRDTELRRNRALVQAAQDAERAARFGVQQTTDRLNLAQEGGRTEDVSIARASSDEIAAMIQQLDAQIDQTEIRAPDDGLIVKRDAHIGDITSPGKMLFGMVRRGQLELRAQIPEVDMGRVKTGQKVLLTSTGGAPLKAGQALFGKIWLITPLVDPQTRLGTARIAIPANAGLRPGMFVRAEIDGGREQALVVPARAVQGSADDRYVFVLDGDKAMRKTVTTGAHHGDDLQVMSGLKAGDEVIIDGGGFLTDGDVVRTTPKTAETPKTVESTKTPESPKTAETPSK